MSHYFGKGHYFGTEPTGDTMTQPFTLTQEQAVKLADWMAQKDLMTYDGAIGGRFVYSFCDTSLGQVVKVRDDLTNTEINLTDYDSW